MDGHGLGQGYGRGSRARARARVTGVGGGVGTGLGLGHVADTGAAVGGALQGLRRKALVPTRSVPGSAAAMPQPAIPRTRE